MPSKFAETTSASAGGAASGGSGTGAAAGGSSPAAPPASKPGWLSSAGSWAMAPVRGAGNLLANTVRGVSTTARGATNAVAGTVGAGVGSVLGGAMTAGSYATDALGLTKNWGPQSWEGTKAFVGTMGDAAMQGAKDTVGGVADVATGGLYDHDGGLLTPKQTAVDNMRQRHVNEVLGGPNSTLSNTYGWTNAGADFATDLAAFSGVGAAAGAGAKSLNAAGRAPALAKTLDATGKILNPAVYNTPVQQVPGQLARTVATNSRAANALTAAAGVGSVASAAGNAQRIAAGQAGMRVDQMFPDADDEQLDQINRASEQVAALPDSQKQTAGAALANPKSPEAQQLAGKGQQNYIAENMANAPQDPQQFGGFMNTMLSQFNAMPMEAKIGMGLGLTGGIMSLMQGLNGGGIGSFLLSALGLGGAGALAAGGGMLGSDAQKLVGDAALGIGKSLGMNVPGKQDLSMLLADDPIAAAKTQGGKNLGFFSSSEDLNAAVASAEEKKKQLEQLQAVPTWLQPTVLRSIDPDNIKTVEDANRAATNAQQVYNQLNNPESAVNKDLNDARWAANFSVFDPSTWRGQQKTSAAVLRALDKYAFNAVDAKELNDLKMEQSKNYNLDNARRLNELTMRKQHAAADKNNSLCSPRAMTVRGPVVRSISITVLRKAARCWSGYEPVPGSKPYSRGSCRPVGSKKTQKEMKKT